jgi:hypothetical protein
MAGTLGNLIIIMESTTSGELADYYWLKGASNGPLLSEKNKMAANESPFHGTGLFPLSFLIKVIREEC